jgi:beta-phosphoglucomutase
VADSRERNGLELKTPRLLPDGLAVIFDMDGVMVNSNPVHRDAWVAFNRRYGIETTEAMLEGMYGRRNDEIIQAFFGSHLEGAEVHARSAAKEELFREMIGGALADHLVPGIAAFLERHADVPMAVASNAEAANLELVLQATGWRRFFRAVVDGHQVSRPKPHPDIYLLAAARLSAEPRNCVVFEDSFSGIAAARAAGMRVVGVRTTHPELPGVDLAIDDFHSAALEPWIRAQRPLP